MEYHMCEVAASNVNSTEIVVDKVQASPFRFQSIVKL